MDGPLSDDAFATSDACRDTHQAPLAVALEARRAELAAAWYGALARDGFSTLSSRAARRSLARLSDRIITLLLTEAHDPDAARSIGMALAELRYLHPAALGRTQQVLSERLVTGLPDAQVAALAPRLALLLGDLASGFLARLQETVLSEQEAIRRSLWEATQASEARFRAVFEQAAVGIALVDRDERRVLACNAAFARMLGYRPGELRGRALAALTHADDEPASLARYRELVAGTRRSYRLEKRYVYRDGRVVWGLLTASLVRDGAGRPAYTIGIVEDVTARKEAEAALATARRLLAAAGDAERGQLALELHDGPLQTLLGAGFYLRAAREQLPNAGTQAPFITVEAALLRASEALRAITRELHPVTLTTQGLGAALCTYAERVRAAYPALDVCVEIGADERAVLDALRLPLFRIAQEAVRNALRHAGASTLIIRLRHDARGLVLEVQDDGRGFAVPEPLTALALGGHLGLLGALERAASIGGHCAVISAPGRGTTLRVTVPLPACTAEETL